MAVTSARVELGDTYTKVVDSADSDFLVQNVGITPALVVTTAAGAAAPAAGFAGYFVLSPGLGLTRTGLGVSDVYMRSGAGTGKKSYVTTASS
jgi:hypothetical protein